MKKLNMFFGVFVALLSVNAQGAYSEIECSAQQFKAVVTEYKKDKNKLISLIIKSIFEKQRQDSVAYEKKAPQLLERIAASFGADFKSRIQDFCDGGAKPLIMYISDNPEYERFFKLLLSLGYNVNEHIDFQTIKSKNQYPTGFSLLTNAAFKNNIKKMKLCLAFGANLSGASWYPGKEVLQVVQSGIVECLEEWLGKEYVNSKLGDISQLPYEDFFKSGTQFLEKDLKFKKAAQDLRDEVMAEGIAEKILEEWKQEIDQEQKPIHAARMRKVIKGVVGITGISLLAIAMLKFAKRNK